MQQHKFEFTGNAKEYFGIWIVNLLLSIVTVGIYTAWAKVRRVRYFYANTHLDGHNFEYHAKPKSILIGRIIVVGALVLYNGLLTITPIATVLLIPYLIALPWIINKALRFNARVTSYRNIRLNFAGTYWRALLVFAIMPILALISLGILGPVASRMRANYIGNNLSYGTAKFSTDVPLGSLYGNWGASLVFFLLAGIVSAAIAYVFVGLSGNMEISEMLRDVFEIPAGDEYLFIIGLWTILGFYLASFLTFLFYSAGVRNLVYGATELEGGHKFVSTMGRLKYVWILLSNLIVVMFTIGLMRPWAAIRTWRYKVENTELLAASNLDGFIAQRAEEGQAASAEFLDIEGIDFGL